MWPFTRKKEERAEVTVDDVLLRALVKPGAITVEQAKNIPTFVACIDIIASTVAGLPIKLYKIDDGAVSDVIDRRTDLLNDETGDLLDGFQFKKAMLVDYLTNGSGYAYVNRERNVVKSLHYIESSKVAIHVGTDPIFKSAEILVNGRMYREFEFVKLLRNTTNGVTGKSIVQDSNKLFAVAYHALEYEETLVKTGGNKKGFFTAAHKLTQEAIDALKSAFKNLYSNNTENVMVLNNGIDFKESTNTSVEMQMNENKEANAVEIMKLFGIPPQMFVGPVTDEVYEVFVKNSILPILKMFEAALNKDLLLPSEKRSFYFAFDTKELVKANVEKRFKAYEVALRNSWLQIDEVRNLEDLPPLGLDFIKLGLQDVLYNPLTGEVYTPNTNQTTNLRGGEKNANRDTGQSSAT